MRDSIWSVACHSAERERERVVRKNTYLVCCLQQVGVAIGADTEEGTNKEQARCEAVLKELEFHQRHVVEHDFNVVCLHEFLRREFHNASHICISDTNRGPDQLVGRSDPIRCVGTGNISLSRFEERGADTPTTPPILCHVVRRAQLALRDVIWTGNTVRSGATPCGQVCHLLVAEHALPEVPCFHPGAIGLQRNVSGRGHGEDSQRGCDVEDDKEESIVGRDVHATVIERDSNLDYQEDEEEDLCSGYPDVYANGLLAEWIVGGGECGDGKCSRDNEGVGDDRHHVVGPE